MRNHGQMKRDKKNHERAHTNSPISFHACQIDAALDYSNKNGKCGFPDVPVALYFHLHEQYFSILGVSGSCFAFAFHLTVTTVRVRRSLNWFYRLEVGA